MALPTIEQQSITSTIAVSGVPSRPYHNDIRLALRQRANNYAVGYLTWPLPAPKGTIYTKFELVLEWERSWNGLFQFRFDRITEDWRANTLTWNHKPDYDIDEGAVYVSASNPRAGDKMVVDLTTLVNMASAGLPWHGVHVAITSAPTTGTYGFLNERSAGAGRPTIRAQWSDAPQKPTKVSPGNGRVISAERPWITTDFIDRNGNTDLAAMRIQTADTNVGWTEANGFPNPTNSHESATSTPATQLWYDLANGASTYVTVSLQDGAGLWSPWSDPTQFGRRAKSPLTLVYPAAEPNNYVEDSTPRVEWSFAGVQRAFQVLIYSRATGRLAYDSGKRVSAENVHTPTRSFVDLNRNTYRIEVRVWDDEDRMANIDDPAHTAVTRDFEYRFTDEVTPFQNVDAEPAGVTPWIMLTAERDTPPDFIDIMRDGEFIAQNVDPAEMRVPGSTTRYHYLDKTPQPRVSHDYDFIAKVNGQSSSAERVSAMTKPISAWLCSLDDDSVSIPILNYSAEIEFGEDGEAVTPLGAAFGYVVHRGKKGRSGSFSGEIGKIMEKSAEDYVREIERVIRDNPGRRMALSYATSMIVGTVWNFQYRPVVYTEEVGYRIGFNIMEREETSFPPVPAPEPDPDPPTPETMQSKIATFNINGGYSGNWDQRIALVAQHIVNVGPEVCLLQEAHEAEGEHQEVLDRLHWMGHTYWGMVEADRNDHFLFDSRKQVPVGAVQLKTLNPSGGWSSQKFRDLETAIEWYTWNTHMRAGDPDAREQQATSMIPWINVLVPSIGGGDLNNSSNYSGSPLRQLQESGTIEVRSLVPSVVNGHMNSFDSYKANANSGDWIDHLFVRGGIQPTRVGLHDTGQASDHNIVWCEFEYTPAAG